MLKIEFRQINSYIITQYSFQHGKRTTYWFPNEKMNEPRFFIEYAISLLKPIALEVEKSFYNTSISRIKGAEWWVQVIYNLLFDDFHLSLFLFLNILFYKIGEK